MSTSEIIALCNIAATVAAIVAAPIIALWIGGKLQARANTRQQQLSVLGVLLSLRHQPLSPENFRALNQIDAIFADNPEVRDVYGKYYAAMNDANLSNPAGYAVRDEKRRDLMSAILTCLGLQNKISTSDLLRTYTPSVTVEIEHLAIWERIKKREDLRAEFISRGIGFPDYVPMQYSPLSGAGTASATVPPPERPPRSPTLDGAQQKGA
jgi:hypothetical protein